MIGVNQDDRQFRRGVVLGLTMAEILLLLIFLLLILLVSRLSDEKALAATAMRDRDLAEQEADDLRAELTIVQQRLGGDFDINKEYVRIQQELIAAEERLVDAEKGMALLEEAKAASPDATTEEALAEMAEAAVIGREVMEEAAKLNPAAGPEDAMQTLIENAETGQAVVAQAQALDPEASPDQALEQLMLDAAAGRQIQAEGTSAHDLLANLDSCQSNLQNCQGQTAFLNNRLTAQGGGFGKKPCWVTPEGGIEYIFAAHLTDAGIILDDYALPHRREDQAKLPLSGVPFGRPMDADEFRRSMSGIYGWSVENECRFVVDVFDETGSAKAHYKRLADAVEDNFFIREK